MGAADDPLQAPCSPYRKQRAGDKSLSEQPESQRGTQHSMKNVFVLALATKPMRTARREYPKEAGTPSVTLSQATAQSGPHSV